MDAYRPPTCTCGHTAGEHKGGARGAVRAPTFGICLARDCSCGEFVETAAQSSETHRPLEDE